CPYCSGYYPSPENNLAVVDPELAKQWHPHKNGEKKPRMFTPGSKQKVWWKCEHGHEWQIGILNRRHGSGCPYCSGKKASKEYNFAVKNPEIALQWHPVKNGKLTPDKVTPWSNKKTWWMCDHGHEWLTKVGNRSRGRGCPICYKERLNKKKTGTN
ncbi:MAG: zinc-ribbon domain-containing protein, partial [bacterium]|nr:zinc-ribbon domain-containing protein [bacterium]